MKALPVPCLIDPDKSFTYHKRKLNKAMERQAEQFSHIKVVNVNKKRPQQNDIFIHKGTLNGRGYEEMWKFMDQFLQGKDSAEACKGSNFKQNGTFDQKFSKKRRWWPHNRK